MSIGLGPKELVLTPAMIEAARRVLLEYGVEGYLISSCEELLQEIHQAMVAVQEDDSQSCEG